MCSNKNAPEMIAPDLTALAERITALQGARVVCVGDVMLDRFVYGEVTRISPEAPIPVCRVTNETAMLGGAGNVRRGVGRFCQRYRR